MLGFHSFSETPFSFSAEETSVLSSLEIPVESLLGVLSSGKIPVEFLGSVLASRKIPIETKSLLILKTFSLPIEVIGAKLDGDGLKWVLSSSDTTWEVSSELLDLIWQFDTRGLEWSISSELKSIWQLNSRPSSWEVKE